MTQQPAGAAAPPPAKPIVRAKIHPGIGIARVGNSPDEFFAGPEVPYAVAAPPGGYRDAAGALKRQAARFRIYGYDADGRVVGELTPDRARITWTVHVANKKAAWYKFELALDLPEAAPCTRRNAAFAGAARQQLVIDPGPRSIAGAEQAGDPFCFDSGTFLGRSVYLGELRTDEQGRLLVLGGRGVADTVSPHNPPITYGNNNGWYDDVADGPVQAEVWIDDQQIEVEPAWVVVAPPNYAPDLISIVTMYDRLHDLYIGPDYTRPRWIADVATPSFTQDIYPIFERFCQSQWVNFGFHIQFGWGGPHHFLRPDYLARLAGLTQRKRTAAANTALRQYVLNMFRNPGHTIQDAKGWPPIYGDDFNTTDAHSRLALTPTQYRHLEQWAAGDFVADWHPHAPPPAQRIEDVPLAAQPGTLDQAALVFCLGGPFHPGCELPWIMRNVTLYYAPFRIRPRAPGQPEPDYGDVLSPALIPPNEIDPREDGPLFLSGPGDITRWLGVPWQADTAGCQGGYEPRYDPYLPTFWPPRVPNHVLRAEDYATVLDAGASAEERWEAFNTRATWVRRLAGHSMDWPGEMVKQFGQMGVIERRDGPAGDAAFPPLMYVESAPGTPPEVPHDRHLAGGSAARVRPRTPGARHGEADGGRHGL